MATCRKPKPAAWSWTGPELGDDIRAVLNGLHAACVDATRRVGGSVPEDEAVATVLMAEGMPEAAAAYERLRQAFCDG